MKVRLRALVSGLVGVVVVLGAVAALDVAPAPAAQPSDPGPANLLPSIVPSSITPSVDDGRVFGIAQVGNTMVIGGSFTSVNGNSRPSVAAFDKTTGALSSFAPNVNNTVNQVIPGPTPNTVFVGGAFTQINGAAASYLALLNLSTGTVVSSFKPPKLGYQVNDLVLRGNNLYVAGTFTTAGGVAHAGLVTLNAATGALDPNMNIQFTGHHNDSQGGAQGPTGVSDIDVTPDGKTMVVIGNFKYANGLLRNQVAIVDLSGPTPQLAAWATDRYAPLCFSWAFDITVRGVSFSPDGSYFVITATGGGNAGTLCDAAARWETNTTDTNAEPTWVDETGGDTLWGVTITNTAIYLGGHNRWFNNPYGVDHPQPGAVPRAGLAALDPQTGRPFAWNPGHVPLGVSPFAFLATADGLWMGSDFDYIGNHKYKRPDLAFFPYKGGYAPAPTTTAGLPGTAYLAGVKAATNAANVLYRINAAGGTIQSLDTGPDWAKDNSDPSTLRNNGSKIATYPPGADETANVPDTTPNAIFDSERNVPSGATMNWTFPVTAGTPIQVRLYFANRSASTDQAGQRVFNVAIDGTTVLNHYDIVADVGDQTGTMKAFNVTSDGTVNINFSRVTGNPLVNGIEIVRTDKPAPAPGSDALTAIGFDGTTATSSSANNQGIDFGDWRGAFMVGNTVYYSINGRFYSRSFDGTTFGSQVTVDPYHDPLWDNVQTGDGDTFEGMFPYIYGQFPNVTSMAYWNGRLYYTLYKTQYLYSKWFEPDSGILDQTVVTQTSSVNFNTAAGMFIVNGMLYYGSSSDGNLRRVSIGADGNVTGSATVVSGPGVDGVNWFNRAMFLYQRQNVAPVAQFSSTCSGMSCSFDGSASDDPDGSIASYSWDFGDGATSTAVSPDHTYTASGTHTVKLTVTDNEGSSSSVSHDVGVATTANVHFVAATNDSGGNVNSEQLTVPAAAAAGDTALLFLAQTDSATWTGPSGIGGWTQVATYTTGSLTTTAWVKTLTAGDLGGTVSFSSSAFTHASADLAIYEGVDPADPVAAATQSGDASSSLHVSPIAPADTGDFAVSYWADRSTTGLTWTAPPELTARSSGNDTGTLTIESLVADSAGSLPSGPYGGYTATTDSSPGAAAAWTIVLNHAGATNQPPTAAFSSNCVQLACSFDGSASSDSDGSITSYAWDFGDGTTSTAVSPNHTYSAPGTYQVTLQVTDSGNATDGVTHPVTAQTSSPNIAFVGAANAGGGNHKAFSAKVPSGAAPGDTAVLFLTQTSTSTWTGPSGWTKIDSLTQGTLISTAWVKTLGASDIGSTVTFSATGYSHASVDLAVYRGVDVSNPIAGFARSGDNGGLSHATPGLTVGSGSYVVSVWADRATAPVAWTAPAGATARESSPDTGTTTVQALLGDSNGIVAAGSVGGQAGTTDVATARTIMWTIALNGV